MKEEHEIDFSQDIEITDEMIEEWGRESEKSREEVDAISAAWEEAYKIPDEIMRRRMDV